MRRFVLVALLFAMPLAASAERRVALVFGADRYVSLRPLQNAANDATAIAGTLTGLGFEVFLEQNRDLRRMRRALDDFREDAAGADVAVVFFAGHGVEISGVNRLLPINAVLASPEDLIATSLPLADLRRAATEIAPVVLILIDACRNDPFGGSSGEGRGAFSLKAAVKPGFGRMGQAENTLFAFAAAPGATALDGTGGNSPFTEALVRYLGTEGVEVRSALTLVQQEVYDRTRGAQLPYVEDGLPRMFFASATTGPLPERERLLLAMAGMTPELRAEVERIAAASMTPLAPLYGAVLAADLQGATIEDREAALAEAARAYAATQEQLRTLASSDPEVARLREAAQNSLTLGALKEATVYLDQAIALDKGARTGLAARLVERTVSEAASLETKAGIARTALDRTAAIAALEEAAALHAEIAALEVPDTARRQRDWVLAGLGDLYDLTGDSAAALDAYRRFEAAAKERIAKSPGVPDARRDLSISYTRIGGVLTGRGDLAGAVAAYRSAFDIAKELASDDPANAEWQRDLSIAANNIGDVLWAQNDASGALAAYLDALTIRQRLAAANPSDARNQRDLAVSFTRIGDAQKDLGNGPLALVAYKSSLDIRRKLARQAPDDAEAQRDLSVGLNRYGDFRHLQGVRDEALAAYQEALTIRLSLVARDPGNTICQRDLSVSFDNIGDLRFASGDKPGALEAYRAGMAIATALAARDPANIGWQRDLIMSHFRLGQLETNGRAHLETALEIALGLERQGQLTDRDRQILDVLRFALGRTQP